MALDMNGVMQGAQKQAKSSMIQMFTLMVKVFTGGMLGVTFALIGQEAFGFGTFSFIFVSVTILGAFLKIAKSWKLMSILLFDAFCILLGFLLKMYILIAPGA
ncbi:MAG: hypothetical protein CL677_10715 [Bdellovibrionaceae bacterium]|nr:hypothetical protein [Pseudobdellovibrionaceae bacterium]|tara:strand:- start:34705 stop:35013 length:309 start_codon:yes stop_codon:yes gene_type:complete